MSTQKFLAEEIRLDHRIHQYFKAPLWWYITEDGRKFSRVDFRPSECVKVKVYLARKLNVHRSQKLAYEIYEVPRLNLINFSYLDNWKWFGCGCEIVYEMKK
jgi:hypothetical protein